MVPKTTACLVEKAVPAAPVDLLLDETLEVVLFSPTVVMPAGRVSLAANPAEDSRTMSGGYNVTSMKVNAAHLHTGFQQLV